MISKTRTILDYGFLVGLVFALFLASKIVPFLILVGVVPIALFWAKADYAKPPAVLGRFLAPTVGYFAFCLLLYYIYPGLQPGEKPPNNPDFELYAVALAMLGIGFLRGQQIRNLTARFQTIVPWSLLAAFAVLTGYMFLGVVEGCRVRAEASWPFIPAIIFTTLSFLLLVGWRRMATSARLLRLTLIALSIVVVFAYTGARGVAFGQAGVLVALAVMRLLPKYRRDVPPLRGLLAAAAAGLFLCLPVQAVTGCGNFERLPAVFDLARGVYAAGTQGSETSIITQADSQVAISDGQAEQATVVATADTVLPTDASITLRLDMWSASLDAIFEAPVFGHGALSLGPVIQERFGFEHNHNQYLAWLVTGGVVFLIFGLLFLSTPFLVSKGLASADRAIVAVSVSGLWGLAMMFDAFLSLDFYLHYFSMLLGFLFALASDMTTSQSQPKEYV